MSYQNRTNALCGLLLCAAVHTLSAQPHFTGIGDLPGGSFISIAQSVSVDGLIVVGDGTKGGFSAYEPILWTAPSGIVSLDTGWRGTAYGANGTGSVIVGNIILAGTIEAFRWTEIEKIIGLGDLPGGGFRSIATGTSIRGDVIVGSGNSENGTWEAFRWTKETEMVGLGNLSGGQFVSSATAISADGLVLVGSSESERGSEAFRWTAETGMVGLGDLPGDRFESYATAISADGSIVVGVSMSTEGAVPFRWMAETGMVAPDFPDPSYGGGYRVFGLSWDGNVIVGEAVSINGRSGAFYWTVEDGFHFLTDVLEDHGVIVPDGWNLYRANAVSADGRTIVGYGFNPQGGGEGWVAYLGPACRADFDESGTVDAEDVVAYIAAWFEQSIFTDWNYDGYINTRDLLGFLNEWVAQPGCE